MEIEDSLTDEAVLTELGIRIRQLRIDRGIPQAALALQANVSLSTLVRLESGCSVQLDSFVRVMRALRQLDKCNLLLPPADERPLQLLRARTKIRKRVSPRKPGDTKPPATWKWGDEQ
jgi:transcriptional regulator with XRE-family HTH domain